MKLPRLAAALAAAGLLTLAACGEDSDTDVITKIIEDGGKDPSSICRHLSPTLLAGFGTVKQCEAQAKRADDGKDAVDIKQLTVDGDAARASISGAQGNQTITFAKPKDTWIVTAIR